MGEKIIAVIGARLNSSRLPRKQLLPLAGKPLIEQLVERLKHVPSLDKIVLATTDDGYNTDLVHWAEGYGLPVEAYAGDVNDLVGRVGSVVRKYNGDIILYVCGDCPLVEPATIEKAIMAVKESPDKEVAAFQERTDGHAYIHEGFDVYRRSFWDRMEAVAERPFEKEHIGAVYQHLHLVEPKDIAYIEDKDIFACLVHRLSVDTSSDYFFMRDIYENWYSTHGVETIVSLEEVIMHLHDAPELTQTNKFVRQRRVGEECPKVAILTEASTSVGLGHLSRMIVASQALQDHLSASVTLFIQGERVENEALSLLPHEWITRYDDVHLRGYDAVIVDVKQCSDELLFLLEKMPQNQLKIAVDQPKDVVDAFDFLWQPCIYLEEDFLKEFASKIDYGWHTFLLKASEPVKVEQGSTRVLVLTGGSDAAGLGERWPHYLQEAHLMHKDIHIDWVQGPYAPEPNIAGSSINILKDQTNLPALIPSYDVVLVVFGVSFFECLQSGVPVIVSNAAGAAKEAEWALIKELFPEYILETDNDIIQKILRIGEGDSVGVAADVRQSMRQGPVNFALRVGMLVEARKMEFSHAS